MPDSRVRVSRWAEVPEILRDRLLDEVAKQIASLAADPMAESGVLVPVHDSAYAQWIWDCAQVLRKEMLNGG